MLKPSSFLKIGALSIALGSLVSAQAEPRDLSTWNGQEELARLGGELPEGVRCLSPEPDPSFVSPPLFATDAGSQADCMYRFTRPTTDYDSTVIYEIPVVFHIIEDNAGVGFVPYAQVLNQIDVFNEDFNALPGSNGAPGNDARIRFVLATVDPMGEPTTGVTYSRNSQWFNDGGQYWNTLAWDTNRYMNVYSNNGGGSGLLGYVPGLPQQGNVVGNAFDRVVVQWDTVGKDTPHGLPWDQGRIATHEVGHYLGLWHTFAGGCGIPGRCYRSGDYICDTSPESSPTNGCGVGKVSCGLPAPVSNYMDYTDDACLTDFTIEQNRRMRCTISQWRPLLARIIQPSTLVTDSSAVSLSAGGTVTLDLESSISMGSWFYVMLGSLTGTSPGVALGNGVVIPLTYDPYFQLMLSSPGSAPFKKARGFLDHNGRGRARFVVPPGSDPTLAGLQLYHAYIASPDAVTFTFASEAKGLLLMP